MHYLEPFKAEEIKETDDACVAGCYRCILSYFNQPDQELIDRRNQNVILLLCALTTAHSKQIEDVRGDTPWLAAIKDWGLPEPANVKIGGVEQHLFWPSKGVLAIPGGASVEVREAAAALGIFDVVDLPNSPSSQPPSLLLSALGLEK